MKKLLATLLLALAGLSLHAAITVGNPAYDPFADASGSGGTSYTVGANLINQKNAQGLTWFQAGPSGNPTPTIASGNLSVTGLTPSTGNSVTYGAAASGNNGMSARLGFGGALNSGTVYYSMAMDVTSLGSLAGTGINIACFNNSTGSQSTQPTALGTELVIRTNGTGGYNLGVNKTGSTTVWDTGVHNVGETVFVVGSYTFNGGNGDSSSLWIDPGTNTFGAGTAPSPTVTTSSGSGIGSAVLNSYVLRVGNTAAPTLTADDVRVGVAWADVTPPVKVSPSFSNLSASQSATYGTTSITVSGTVSAPGPIYPASGENVVVTIDGKPQTNTISDSTGDFSFSYNPSSIPATGTPYTITYSYAGDVFLSSASDSSTTLTVNHLVVSLSGARLYDGTATASASVLSVANKVGSDDVTLASGSANLAGASAGSESITSVGTLTLGGTTATNYTLAGASGSVTVNPLPVVLTGTRAYDGTANAAYTILSISNKVGSDDVTLISGTAALAGSSAGVELITSPGTLTLGGTTAGDYTLTGASGAVTITGGIIVVSLSGTRAYDGTANASYTILTIANKVGGDDVFLASGTATLAGSAPGSQSVTSPGTLTLGGAQASKYTLTGATGSVTITALPVVLTGTRVYDGTSNAAFGILTISNVVGSDDVSLASGSATLAASSAGAEAISSGGTLTLAGTTASDYTVTGASGTVTITPLTVVLIGKKPYDGTATVSASVLSVSNKIGSDDVTVASGSGTLAGSNFGPEAITSVGTLALGGTTAIDYSLTGATGSVFVTFGAGYPIYDPFADASAGLGTHYNIGDDLIGETNSQGLTWYQAGPNGTQPQPTIVSGNLSVSGLVASTGNSAQFGNANGDSARLGLGVTLTNGTLYYSVILQVSSLGALTTSGAVMGGFNNSTGSQTGVPTVFGTQLKMRLSGSGSYNLGMDHTGSGTVWDTGVYNPGDTVFVVGSYTLNTNSANDDTSAMWINPPSTSFGSATAPTPTLTSSTGGDISAGQIASFVLREGSTAEPVTIVDDIRIGYSWADVTPSSVIVPSSITITSQSLDSTGTNVVLTWTSVSGAVYQVIGSTNVSAPRNTWTNVGSPITATGTSTTTTNPVTPPTTYFEVESP